MPVSNILIVSDIHYACGAEKKRVNYEMRAITNPRVRAFVKWFRYHVWQRDPFAHNHLLKKPVGHAGRIDLAVANGDYSCDSAFIGVSDPAALKSAQECLGQLRERFGTNLHAIFGDHELGKMSLAGKHGGPRVSSWNLCRSELGLKPFWQVRLGRYVLMGVTSTLIALPVYEPEALPEEVDQWRALREEHLAEIRNAFAELGPRDRVLLFCHDPTALPYLWEEERVRQRAAQIERTIIGHLHTTMIWYESLILAGMPEIRFLGQSIRRMSRALHRARDWRPFKALLCPSLAGSELLHDGGYYVARVDHSGNDPVIFDFHPVPRSKPEPGIEPVTQPLPSVCGH